uniref:Spermatogenesis-defective protein 39 homolog n=1 Tax=Cynoglossus semilaevis TaxID=244447 RepID=A0A3P8VAA5_CYNSE
MTRTDEEEYWNSSKFKAFTFDDDEDELSTLQESKRAVDSISGLVGGDEDEDQVEIVGWGGEPVDSIVWSVRETAASTNQRPERESTPQTNTGPSQKSRSQSVYSLSSLFRGDVIVLIFSESSALSDSTTGRLFAPELRKPKSEYKEEWVRRVNCVCVCFQVVSLEKFRSLQEKLLLLDYSVKANDGNVITAVLIFLKKTLSKEILFQELQSRQTALRHFINFLYETEESGLLLELLRSLGRTEDAALLQYKEHQSISDESRRRDFLKSCLRPVNPIGFLSHLLERQIIMERGGKVEIFQKVPRKSSILNMPLVTTVYYACVYHYNEAEGTLSSPHNLRQTFRISEKQFFVTALAARAKLKAWSDVDALFFSRNWLGPNRKKTTNSAPPKVLQDYVGLVDDAQLRLSLAHKHKCHDIVINTYRDLKDRQLLLGYRTKVEVGSEADSRISQLLDNPKYWKEGGAYL